MDHGCQFTLIKAYLFQLRYTCSFCFNILLFRFISLQASTCTLKQVPPRRPNDLARLISPSVTNTGPQCLQFYYHMYGQHIGRLNVYVKTGTTLPSAPMWTKSQNQGNKWTVAQTTIQASQQYQVMFVCFTVILHRNR